MKIYNFSAGPAVLPEAVLKEAQEEMLDFNGSGISVMEMSHRSKDFEGIIKGAEASLRRLADIPDDYEVLFLQGGASSQFAMIPMNLMKNGKADYIITGNWAQKAYDEAVRYGDIKVLASSADDDFSYIPDLSKLEIREDADYVYMTENNTIFGTQFNELPDTKGKVLVNDASSCILSKPFNVRDFGLIYAGAQKNLGPAGVTLVIIRKDLIREDVMDCTPTMFKYKIHADNGSLYNTPPTYGIYIMGKVFKWLEDMGGLEAIEKINREKAGLLYDFLDKSELFKGIARKDSRSMMNVSFKTGDKDLDARFIDEAKARGFINLKGHRKIGGMRASIYNAMPVEGVKALVAFMEEFERNVK